mmetsp:Transcript_13397/g.36031  ORF Transcript_13397/g.36031 Transcript_13397/m.36031 type:complete len:246 (+) Transcript_13397:363-1100(+)
MWRDAVAAQGSEPRSGGSWSRREPAPVAARVGQPSGLTTCSEEVRAPQVAWCAPGPRCRHGAAPPRVPHLEERRRHLVAIPAQRRPIRTWRRRSLPSRPDYSRGCGPTRFRLGEPHSPASFWKARAPDVTTTEHRRLPEALSGFASTRGPSEQGARGGVAAAGCDPSSGFGFACEGGRWRHQHKLSEHIAAAAPPNTRLARAVIQGRSDAQREATAYHHRPRRAGGGAIASGGETSAPTFDEAPW